MSKKTVHGLYDDDEVALKGAKKLVASGFQVKEVFSPFPIHGMEDAIGVPRTRMGVVSFMFGITGTGLLVLLTWYTMEYDWAMDIGGKPSSAYFRNVAAFVPPIFEGTVFCASHLMALTFFLRSWILPGVSPKNPDPRTTDDKFMLVIETDNADKVKAIMKETGAIEVNVK
jgi:hypothetical protein